MSRRRRGPHLLLAVPIWVAFPATAQERAQERLEPPSATAEEAIDAARSAYGPRGRVEDCSAEQEAAALSGEIVVCRRQSDGSPYRLYDNDTALKELAERTKYEGVPRAPDFLLDCHDQGYPVGCVKLGSAPPPAYMVDFDSLPDAPPGSDADRIARGLPPLGRDAPPAEPAPAPAEAPPSP